MTTYTQHQVLLIFCIWNSVRHVSKSIVHLPSCNQEGPHCSTLVPPVQTVGPYSVSHLILQELFVIHLKICRLLCSLPHSYQRLSLFIVCHLGFPLPCSAATDLDEKLWRCFLYKERRCLHGTYVISPAKEEGRGIFPGIPVTMLSISGISTKFSGDCG